MMAANLTARARAFVGHRSVDSGSERNGIICL